MSKERAKRRAERLALAERVRQDRERAQQRRVWRRNLRRALVRRIVPPWVRGRTGRLFARRSRTQRAVIVTAVVIALLLVWTLVDPLATRIGLTALIAIVTPVLVVLSFDRRI